LISTLWGKLKEFSMKIQINDGFLSYDMVGRGMPVLFIHGYPLSRKMWEPQIESMSERGTLISLDLRGHGESFPFTGPYSMALLAEDCKHILDTLKITGPVVICGLSMGGYITMALYRKYPGLFKGMILTATRSGPDSAEGKLNRDAAIKMALEKGAGAITESMLPKMFSPKTLSSNQSLVKKMQGIMADTSVNGIVGALQGLRDRPDSTPLLSQVKCPTLIIHGVDDQLIPIKEAEMMNENIPNSRLIKIADAGHLLNLEQPEIFNRGVLDFLLKLS
jgi:pimeloyl-ACP methyl ester carboxylesterase